MDEKPQSTAAPNPDVGWVLYDASCGVCRTGMTAWERSLHRHGFGIRPIQDPWVQEHISVPQVTLLNDLQLILYDGRRLSGEEAYRYILRQVWWTYPLYLISRLPGFRLLFNRTYRAIATHRHTLSTLCRLS
jgi:predicted DCC family thiol-disulfide oxidoreductase YuxK